VGARLRRRSRKTTFPQRQPGSIADYWTRVGTSNAASGQKFIVQDALIEGAANTWRYYLNGELALRRQPAGGRGLPPALCATQILPSALSGPPQGTPLVSERARDSCMGAAPRARTPHL